MNYHSKCQVYKLFDLYKQIVYSHLLNKCQNTVKTGAFWLYKTRYMLDELGNLQSEGHGISGFETMLSIGLGQEQQFTLILQTLQQLKDVYGVMILSTNRVAAYL